MKINDAGLKLIKKYEGCKLKAYKCPAGVWTIGYGHTAGVTEGMKITQVQADQYLKNDMVKYEGYVDKYCADLALNENQFSALVSFTYNCGAANLVRLIKGRTLAQIADAMLLYNKASGKVLNGLTKRRKAERELFLSAAGLEYLKCSGDHTSIKDALASIGVDNSYSYRKKLAAANGIKGYVGNAAQNIKLLGLLKNGKLLRA